MLFAAGGRSETSYDDDAGWRLCSLCFLSTKLT
jgi:hypothetical protein